MTENDKRLLKEAEKITDYSCWGVLAAMAEKADSKEVREIIDRKSINFYHYEEYSGRQL